MSNNLTVEDIFNSFRQLWDMKGTQLFQHGFPDFHGVPHDVPDGKIVSDEVFSALCKLGLIEKHRQARGWSLFVISQSWVSSDNNELLRDKIETFFNQ